MEPLRSAGATPTKYVTDWPGFGAQRNRALALCRHDWVFNIDADEVVSYALCEEIQALLMREKLDCNL